MVFVLCPAQGKGGLQRSGEPWPGSSEVEQPAHNGKAMVRFRYGPPYWGVAKPAKARDFDSRIRWFKSSNPSQALSLRGQARGKSLKPARTPKGVFGSVAQLARALAC